MLLWILWSSLDFSKQDFILETVVREIKFVVVVVLILCYYLFLQKIFYYYYILFILFSSKLFLFFMFRDVPGCSDMFRNVPACSGMFRVPGFIDARFKIVKLIQFQLFTPLFDWKKEFCNGKAHKKYKKRAFKYLLLCVSKLEVFTQLPRAYHENSWTSMVSYRDYIQ